MKSIISRLVFSRFNWKVLTEDERGALEEGIEKHASILKQVLGFLPFQIVLALISPELFVLLSAVSFITLFLGGAWFNISFKDVSKDQLDSGVATFITKKMFRGYRPILAPQHHCFSLSFQA